MKRLSFLFKDIKEYNKYLLSILSIFIILLAGIISYNYTNSSYAKWSSSASSGNVMKLGVDILDTSGANAPELASNMIPVYYDEANAVWRKADSGNSGSNWYNYDNKKWANAVTVTSTNRTTYLNASVGTEISMDD